ncbi:hypothetical protein NBRC110019_30580 [Neptunitalea chrysea]|uniref:Uncharacterized protein n=1 Tax=Neptunitalea chrysea TaxID=1647581 RepID=A0A9W6B8K8_9FLAO|nr:hypothetical protein [Neptunitalea chrysea]GLB54017.1 hypothetical protein NBRC110019_30580 [Neptunitalea chrysea]
MELDKIFIKENSLFNTVVKEIRLFLNISGEVEIELIITNFSSRSIFKTIKLSFIGVIEYSFFYNLNYYFYNIEDYKFFKTNSYYYLSLDPDMEIEEISQKDMDFIKCKNIELEEME